MAARLVQNFKEMKGIFDELNRSADDYSLPVRGILQFVLNGTLPTGKLFVNNDRSVVAVLHELSEYSTLLDGDTVGLYIKNIDAFRPFFQRLSKERLWKRRILQVSGIRHDLKELVKSMLPDVICEEFGPMQLQHVPDFVHDVAVTLPPGFRMAPGKVEDAREIVDSLDYGALDKLKMFQWMLKKFPSVTIRDSDDNPVAWTLTFNHGGSAALYVKPEFRRHRFGQAITAEICRQHAQLLPCPRYAGVSPNNTVSMAFSGVNTDVLVYRLIFGLPNPTSKM